MTKNRKCQRDVNALKHYFFLVISIVSLAMGVNAQATGIDVSVDANSMTEVALPVTMEVRPSGLGLLAHFLLGQVTIQ